MERIESASKPFSRPERDRWAKEVSCEELADCARSHGQIPDTRAIEEQIHTELQQSIAKERERPFYRQPLVGDGRGKEVVAREAAKRDVKIIDPTKRPKRKRIRRVPKTGRVLAREARIRALLAFDAKRHDFKYPGPAKEIIRAQLRANAGKGEFEGVSRKMADKIITRILDDICDRTNLLFGSDWKGLT